MMKTINETTEPMRLNLNGLPLPEDDVVLLTAITQRLGGHVVASGWLPEELHPELDKARAEHVRRLGQSVEAADQVNGLQERWDTEDAAHGDALRDAAREGAKPPADKRTTDTDREGAEKSAAENLWATLMVLVEAVDAAVEVLRSHEVEMLADLQGRAGEAEEDRREAERLVESARRHEWCQHRLAQWILTSADDAGGFGQQPAPTGEEPPPAAFRELNPRAFERAWHQGREWNRGTGAAPEPEPAADTNTAADSIIQPLGA